MRWPSKSLSTLIKEQEEWHPHFALWPVRIGEEMFWLETVSRRITYSSLPYIGPHQEVEYRKVVDSE